MSEKEILLTDPKQPFLKDKHNKEEKHKHKYYRLLWYERPQNQKQVKQYWTWIQNHKEKLLYKPPKKISTLYEWFHRWNWQEWEIQELTKEINFSTKNKITSNANYTLNKVSDETIFLSEFLSILQEEIGKGLTHFNINDPKLTKNIIQLVTLYTQILKLLSGINIDLNDSYNLVRIMANETTQSNSSTFVKMLEESKKYFIEYGVTVD